MVLAAGGGGNRNLGLNRNFSTLEINQFGFNYETIHEMLCVDMMDEENN